MTMASKEAADAVIIDLNGQVYEGKPLPTMAALGCMR